MKTSALTCLFALVLCGLKATEPDVVSSQEECGKGPRPMRASVRYTTPKGIGYKQGYTTLEGFLAPSTFGNGAFLPFLDLRGHVFDSGQLAANAGVGLRYLAKRIWGGNLYYDYRNTAHQHYNQVSIGLESLGRVWDFRINGYLPVGLKQSPLFHSRFAKFQGHNILIRSTYDFAMKGANAEVGAHLDHFRKAPLYFAAGPYYLTGKGKTTWGGSFRVAVDLFNHYVRLEANTAYDHFFKWTGQGQVSINIPFGKKREVKRRGAQSCAQATTLSWRAMQPVERNEIIPVGQQHITSIAINPETGLPYYLVFVGDMGSFLEAYETIHPSLESLFEGNVESFIDTRETLHPAPETLSVDEASALLGTYENPFPSLEEAERVSQAGQIIYVLPEANQPSHLSYREEVKRAAESGQIIYVVPSDKGPSNVPYGEARAPVHGIVRFLQNLFESLHERGK